MFIRRFLQTSVSFQSKSTDIFLFSNLLFPKEPLKSKLNRYERILEEIGPIYKEIKVERLRNLNNLIIESDDDDFSSIKIGKIGKIPTVEIIKLKLENCSNWEEIENLISILKEIRFLGSPKRKEISRILFKKLEEIYENIPKNDFLIKNLYEMVKFEQLNPLIIPKEEEVKEESTEIYKKIVYTAKDLIISRQ